MAAMLDGAPALRDSLSMGPAASLLLVGALNGAVLAVAVARGRRNRPANRLLAALLLLVSLRLGIYILGFSGAYDAHPRLTFLPLDLSAAFAPLLWLYVRRLTGSMPPRWPLHLLPAAAQLGYYATCFALPLPAKWRWYTTVHLDLVEPIAIAAILTAAAFYLAGAWRRYQAYQRWLDSRFASREQWRLAWLRGMLLAFAAFLAAVAGFASWHALVAPLDYFGRLPVMLGCGLLAYALGLLGWRYGDVAYPLPAPAAEPEATDAGIDYAALADGWRRRIEEAGWWREDALTLADVARRLAVSTRTLSRGLNQGDGRNFNASINAMRVAAIQRALADPAERRDLLALALDHGFASKASFNRAFRRVTGAAPSDWRRKSRQSDGAADFEATPAPR